jgi:hypothetical protein
MTVRTALKLASASQLQQVNSTENNRVIALAVAKWLSAPSVTLTRFSSNQTTGALANISDTRYTSGTSHVATGGYPSEATTQEPQLLTTNWRRIVKTSSTGANPADTNNVRFPIYYVDDGAGGFTLKSMSKTDFFDTFIDPAIDDLVGSTYAPYKIHTSTTLTNYTSQGAIFKDTQANTTGMTAAEIGVAGTKQTDATTNTTYYLMKRTGGFGTPSAYPTLLHLDTSGNINQYDSATFGDLIQDVMQAEVYDTLSYSMGTTGTALGSNIVNKAMTTGGTGLRRTRLVNTNDYRAQEMPNGTVGTINTYKLTAQRV